MHNGCKPCHILSSVKDRYAPPKPKQLNSGINPVLLFWGCALWNIYYKYVSFHLNVHPKTNSKSPPAILQGPAGRPGIPGADGVPGPPGTILMLPVSPAACFCFFLNTYFFACGAFSISANQLVAF